MGFSNQERINLNSKVLATSVKDANPVSQWYESFFANKFVLTGDKVWTNPDLATLLSAPARNVSIARSNAATYSSIIQDLSDASSAVRLTEVPGTNGSTYATYSIYNDFSSPRLENWIQPQLVPRKDSPFEGFPSVGYAVRLYNGDPNSGGVEITTTQGQTGSGINASVGWVFDYGNGLLLLSSDFKSIVTDPWIVGFRYIGTTAGTGGGGDAVVTVEQNQESISVDSPGQTEFILSNQPLDDTNVQMFINGVKQEYGTDYSVVGTSIAYTGTNPPSLVSTDIVEFWYLTTSSIDLGQQQETIPVTFTGQTSFTLSNTPIDDGYVQMFINGIKQQYGVDYFGNGNIITYTGTISPPLGPDDIVDFWYLTNLFGASGGNDGGGGGSQTLADTLLLGNTTGGTNLEISGTDAITNEIGSALFIRTKDVVSGTAEDIELITGGGSVGGGSIRINAGNGVSDNGGGIFFNTGSSTSDQGGSFFVQTGNSSSGRGGSFSFQGGFSDTDDGGGFFVRTGTGGTGGSSGDISLSTVAFGPPSNSGSGYIDILTGDAVGASRAGYVNIKTGASATGSVISNSAGYIDIEAGNGRDGNAGGWIEISAGFSDDAGNAGYTTIRGGRANGSGQGGTVSILGGQGNTNDGGNVIIESGFSSSGDAGSVFITGSSGSSSGGDVFITSGSGSTNGNISLQTLNSGYVVLNTSKLSSRDGVSFSDDVTLKTGTSTSNSGDLILSTGTAQNSGDVSLFTANSTGSSGGIDIETGDSGSSLSGNINISTGNGPTRGTVTISGRTIFLTTTDKVSASKIDSSNVVVGSGGLNLLTLNGAPTPPEFSTIAALWVNRITEDLVLSRPTFPDKIISTLTNPTANEDGYVPIASGNNINYLRGDNDGDVLTWNEINSTWESAPVASSSSAANPSYEPINFTPTDTDIDGYLEGIDIALSSTISINKPTVDQDGYVTIASGGDLTYIIGDNDGDVLTWNSISGTWESQTPSVSGGTGIGPNTLTITSTTQTAQTTGWQVLSAFEFNPLDYDGYTTIEFRALIETTNASDAVEIRLFNIDTASVVVGSTLSTANTTTTLASADITNQIDTSSSIYEVQLRLANTGSPNSALCKRAEIRVL